MWKSKFFWLLLSCHPVPWPCVSDFVGLCFTGNFKNLEFRKAIRHSAFLQQHTNSFFFFLILPLWSSYCCWSKAVQLQVGVHFLVGFCSLFSHTRCCFLAASKNSNYGNSYMQYTHFVMRQFASSAASCYTCILPVTPQSCSLSVYAFI